jgi:dihydrolipoamide dehydrogenase
MQEYDLVVVGSGSGPSVPPIEGLDDVDHLTSTEALRLEDRPDRLVIVGGGCVAAELGTFLGAFGTDVTVIGRRPRLLPETDPEVGAAFTDAFREGHTVHVGYEAVAVSESGGTVTVTARALGAVAGSRSEAAASLTRCSSCRPRSPSP